MVVFREIHMFLKLIGKCIVGTKRAYHNFEKSTFQDIFLSKPNSNLTGKQRVRC
jgi:hypothetical protein